MAELRNEPQGHRGKITQREIFKYLNFKFNGSGR